MTNMLNKQEKMPKLASTKYKIYSDDEWESISREIGFSHLQADYYFRFNTLLEQVEFHIQNDPYDWFTFLDSTLRQFHHMTGFTYGALSLNDIFFKLQFDLSSHFDPLKEYFGRTDVFDSTLSHHVQVLRFRRSTNLLLSRWGKSKQQ